MTDKKPDTSLKGRVGRQTRREARLDEALDESFPASDPVSINIETPDTSEAFPKNSSDE